MDSDAARYYRGEDVPAGKEKTSKTSAEIKPAIENRLDLYERSLRNTRTPNRQEFMLDFQCRCLARLLDVLDPAPFEGVL